MTRGEHMKAARQEAELTLRQLAKLSGVSWNEISQLELEKRCPRVDTVELLADALGLTIDEYIGHEKKEAAYAKPEEEIY